MQFRRRATYRRLIIVRHEERQWVGTVLAEVLGDGTGALFNIKSKWDSVTNLSVSRL